MITSTGALMLALAAGASTVGTAAAAAPPMAFLHANNFLLHQARRSRQAFLGNDKDGKDPVVAAAAAAASSRPAPTIITPSSGVLYVDSWTMLSSSTSARQPYHHGNNSNDDDDNGDRGGSNSNNSGGSSNSDKSITGGLGSGRDLDEDTLDNDHFDMEELKRRIAAETNPYSDMFADAFHTTLSESDQQRGGQAENAGHGEPVSCTNLHIVLFQPGTEQQGVHAIEYPKGSGSNVIMAFESLEACREFAQLLKAQQFYDPTPYEIDADNLNLLCEQLGIHAQVIPRGVQLIPPGDSVKRLSEGGSGGDDDDNDPRRLREEQWHLEYVFAMLDDADFDDEGVIFNGAGAGDDEGGRLGDGVTGLGGGAGSWE